ncbi:PIG-L deacetylase family protein [Paenibacillus phoenicis]|jgi:LmbE family N-acetylglucosaminyl deacetylase|uniref:PIG-L deacetylase family protein n=1 Tax=Paenibacillus phoenicis TaxID=554117 RepID=A0ABU5PKP7_9BACL|nr:MULTISPECIES: PIG-L deacetylase family protein [Paenibacillus]MEA3570506.1 PIG-L deacetylase family protein [Paenibacillus phoenicis]SMF63315.1 N-acetylglucosaminyl deacetylase, LmbE family [Paenibacillus barengoltzii]
MEMDKPQHILAIGGHAGDMDLTAGAVIAKYVQAGHKATFLHLTPGEKGHPKLSPDDYAKQKIEEAHRFAEIVGADVRFLAYKDAELPVDEEVKYQVADVIREVKPTLLITHWKGSMHKDHANTHYIVEDARFYAALKTIERALPNHYSGPLYYTDNWEDPYDFQPEVFVDIPEEAYETWVKAMNVYAYARGETSGFPFIEYYKALTIVRGAPVGFKRAQAFMVPRGALNKRVQFL